MCSREAMEPAARLWDAATGLELRSFDANASFFSVALSPDGHYVLAGGRTGLRGYGTPRPGTCFVRSSRKGRSTQLHFLRMAAIF